MQQYVGCFLELFLPLKAAWGFYYIQTDKNESWKCNFWQIAPKTDSPHRGK